MTTMKTLLKELVSVLERSHVTSINESFGKAKPRIRPLALSVLNSCKKVYHLRLKKPVMIGFFSFSIQIFRLVKSCLQIILTHGLTHEEKCVSASADNKSMVAKVAANICGYFFALFIKKLAASC